VYLKIADLWVQLEEAVLPQVHEVLGLLVIVDPDYAVRGHRRLILRQRGEIEVRRK
jgi:hypothetical protein